MRRVVLAFTCVALAFPLIVFVAGGNHADGGALTVAGVTTSATLVCGVPAYCLFLRCGWVSWWQFAFGGALIGLLCSIPFAVGGSALVAALAPTFLALGALHGVLFWVLTIWRNAGLMRRSTGRAGAGFRLAEQPSARRSP